MGTDCRTGEPFWSVLTRMSYVFLMGRWGMKSSILVYCEPCENKFSILIKLRNHLETIHEGKYEYLRGKWEHIFQLLCEPKKKHPKCVARAIWNNVVKVKKARFTTFEESPILISFNNNATMWKMWKTTKVFENFQNHYCYLI